MYKLDFTRADYLTPPEIIKKILAEHERQSFDTDVCCTIHNIPAKTYYTEKENGLMQEWGDFNYCNPPFNECEKWIKKASSEQEKGKTTIFLIPARTETAYWHKYILNKENVSIEFLKKGLRFINPDTMEFMNVFKMPLAIVTMSGNITNYQKIKNYSIDKMVHFINHGMFFNCKNRHCIDSCMDCVKYWLESEE